MEPLKSNSAEGYQKKISISYFPVLDVLTFLLSLIVPTSAYLSGSNLFWVSILVLFFYLTSFFHSYYINVSLDHIKLVPLIFFLRPKNIRSGQIIKVVSVEDFTVENNFPIGSKKYRLLYRSNENKGISIKFSIQNRKKEKALLERFAKITT
jgi:hypothetical protein